MNFFSFLFLSKLTPLFLPSSSVSLSYFNLVVPMRECLGKHPRTSSPFPIAILNGTYFVLSQVLILFSHAPRTLLQALFLKWPFKPLIKIQQKAHGSPFGFVYFGSAWRALGNGWPELQLVCRNFFVPSPCTSSLPLPLVLSCFILVVPQLAQVFEKAVVCELHISYSYTERNFLSLRSVKKAVRSVSRVLLTM